MHNARRFTEKIAQGQLCLGTCISTGDPSITEALAPDADFFWIDLEHTSITGDQLRQHFMGIKGSEAAAIVRVPTNDAVQIKTVLDIGADGIIVPMIGNADDVAEAVSACKYPPEGIRGFGPLRPTQYARIGAEDFIAEANKSILTICQIEQKSAVDNIDEILQVPGLSSLAFGPMDLSASLGHRGQPGHPAVLEAVQYVTAKAKEANVPVGVSIGSDAASLKKWRAMGMQWIAMGVEVTLMIDGFRAAAAAARS